jgi:hypothetical protein
MKYNPKKYKHIGYSWPGVPKGWEPIVEKALIEIEKEMWPRWIPMFLKRWIHYLATGNSVVRIKYRWAYKLRSLLTNGQCIQDVKEKYATLRIYAYARKEICDIIEKAEKECNDTCQDCGGTKGVETVEKGRWYENLCEKCYVPTRKVITEKY